MSDIITSLKALDDEALLKKVGLADKLNKFKSDLERADKLEGDKRQKIAEELERMFTPNDYVMSDLHWQLERAEKPCKEPMSDCSPCSMLAECNCGEID